MTNDSLLCCSAGSIDSVPRIYMHAHIPSSRYIGTIVGGVNGMHGRR